MANDKNFKVKNGLDTGSTITTPSHGTSANWKSAYDYSQVGHLPLSGGTLTGELIIDTSTNNYFKLYTEGNTATIADTFGGNTDKSYIYFYATSGSNDPGYIMHETRSGDDSNEGVLHLVPSDDNATGDYVSIHGTNDADVLKLHTSGLIETASNYQLTLKSGSGSVKIDDNLQVYSSLEVVGYSLGNLNSTDDIGQALEYGNTACATLRFDSDRWRVWAGGASGTGENLTVLETGNVGIGDTDPANKLAVNGVISATGGNSTNWNTAYSNHLTDLSFSGGTLTASKQTGTETVSLDGRYLKISDFSGTLDAAYARTEKATITGVNSSSYVTAFNVVGNDHSAGIKASFGGTSGSVVINVLAEIIVGHSKDITIKTTAGFYTVLTIKVTSNDNDDYAVEVKHNGSSTTSLKVEVFPQGSETITFPSSHSYTGESLEHVASRGVKFTSVDGNNNTKTDLDIDGNYKVAGTTVIDTEKKGIFEGLTIDSNETNGIMITEQGDTDGNSAYNVMKIRSTPSGSATLLGDRIHSALYIDIDQTATGHNGLNDFQNYGIFVDNRSTGATQMKGVYSRVESQNSSDISDSIIAVDGIAVSDETGTARTTTVIGTRGIADGQGDGSGGDTTLYGVQGLAQLNSNTSSDNNNILYGGRFEINYETPSNGASYTPSSAYVVNAVFDDNSLGKFTTNKSYLFYGDYQIAPGTGSKFPTNAYGLYLTDTDSDVVSYIGHNLGIGDTTPEEKLTVAGNIKATGTLSASGYNDSNWDTAYTYSQVGHLPLTGGSLTGGVDITTSGPQLFLKTSSHTDVAQIKFSTNSNGSYAQFGTINFDHTDTDSYGSKALFEIGSSEDTTTILADGKLMYNEGIYSKPGSGTGAGTRKDENWDTAYTYSQVGHLPLAGGTITGGITLNNNFVQNTANKNFITSGKQITDLDDAWSNGVTYGKSSGIQPFRYQSNASNLPTSSTGDNANWGLNIYSHGGSNESAEAYGLQLSGRNNEAGALYLRRSSNGTFSAWRKVWHEGNDGAASGLDADLLDGQHGSYYAPINAPDFTGGVDIAGATTITSGTDVGLKITHNQFAEAIVLHRNDASNAPAIKFTNNSGTGGAEKQLGIVFVDSDANFKFRDFSTSNQHKVYHEGVFTNNSSNWNTAYGDKVDSIDFNTSDGTLTLNRQDGGTVTKDLDGRYALLSGSTISGEVQTERVKRWIVNETGNISDDRWYKIATLDGGNSGITIRGTINNHVESFGTQRFDLSFFGRADNATDDINVAGTFEIANAAGGGRGVGVRVIQIPDAGTYDDRDVYIRLSRYCHANVTIYIEGNTNKVNVNLDQSSSNYVTTEPSAGTDNVNLIFDNTATAEGHYSVMNNVISKTNTTVGTDTNVTTDGSTIIDDLTLTQGVITAASTRTLSLSDLGYTGATDANKYVLPTATSVAKGGIELWDNTVQDTAAQAVTTTANRTYGIQLNSNGQAVVNVPWSGISGGGTLSSTLKVTGSIIHEYNSNGGYIARPKGAQYVTSSNLHTGAIKIKLPTHGTADMMSFWVDIFDYSTSESITMWIGGYNYQTTGNNEWVNCTALIFTEATGKSPKNVRFGADGSNSCVWIGEVDETWSYPQIIVRDFQAGYTTDIDAYDDDWNISFVTSFDTVDETHAAKGPVTEWDRVEGKPTIPTNTNQLTNGAGFLTDSSTQSKYLRSDADDTASGTYIFSRTSTTPAIDISGHAGASSYNYFMRAGNDSGNRAVHFVNGSTRTADHGANAYVIRNDGGTFVLGKTNHATKIYGNGDLTYNDNEVWHAGNDGAGSGLDADKLDGVQGSGYLRSDVADTAAERITFTKGINVNDLGSGGIFGNNYNISGVNQITINDPGEGIIWAGTNGSDPDVTLYVIDADNKDVVNIANASDLQVDGESVKNNASIARALGWVPAYGSAAESNLTWNSAEDAVELQSDTDTSTGMAHQAFEVRNGETYKFSIALKGSAATANDGLYLRIYGYNNTAIPAGKTHVSHNASHTLVQEDAGSMNKTNWQENVAVPDNWTTYETTYTPASDGWVSLVVLNWTAHGTKSLYVKQPNIHLVKASDADKLDGQNGSYYINTSGTAQTKSGDLTVSGTLEAPTLQGSTGVVIGEVDDHARMHISNNNGSHFGFDPEHSRHLIISNEQGSTNQVMYLADSGATAGGSIWGVSLTTVGPTTGGAHLAGSEAYTNLIDLDGLGTLSIPSKLAHMGDANTHLLFDADRIRLIAGGTTKIDTNTNSGHIDVSGGIASPIGSVSGVNAQGEVVLVAAVSHVEGHITGGTTATFTSGGQVIFNQVGTLDIKANSITANNIKANTIDTDKLAANTITAKHIEASSVVADLITANSIKTDTLAANVINADKIAGNIITAKHIESDSVVSNLITANSVKAANIKANTITSTQINAANATFDNLVSAYGDISEISANNIDTNVLNSQSIIARTIRVASGTVPSIDANTGQPTGGKGALINSDGDFFVGDPSASHMFFDQSEGKMHLRSGTSGARMALENDTLKVFDSNGNLRVHIGNLSS